SGSRDNISSDIELIVGDVRDHELLQVVLPRVDGVFHMAAVASVSQCTEAWLDTHNINQSAWIGLLETVAKTAREQKKAPAPCVFASSAAVYGDQQTMPIAETA